MARSVNMECNTINRWRGKYTFLKEPCHCCLVHWVNIANNASFFSKERLVNIQNHSFVLENIFLPKHLKIVTNRKNELLG